MKKTFILGLMMIMCINVLGGCGKKAEDTEKAQKTVNLDVEKVADQLNSDIKYDAELSKVDDDMFSTLYDCDEDKIEKKSAYMSAEAKADEIVVVEAKDEDAAKDVETSLKEHLETQKENFASYMPEEVNKIEDAVLKCSGKYVVLSISGDTKKAESILNDYGM